MACALQSRARGLVSRQRSRELHVDRVSAASAATSQRDSFDSRRSTDGDEPTVEEPPQQLGAIVGDLMDKLGLGGWDGQNSAGAPAGAAGPQGGDRSETGARASPAAPAATTTRIR